MRPPVSVSREIAAPADRVWAMVADVTRMPEWSPENEAARWLRDATGPVAGAKFQGTNRHESKRWKSVCTVTECEPGHRFTFSVKAGPLEIAEWSYTFEPTANGCEVTETWTDHRSAFTTMVSKRVTGVHDRPTHNRRTMEQTLARLAAAAEANLTA